MSTKKWLAESLRFTVFLAKATENIPDWWFNVTGELPEVKNQNPRRGVIHEEGAFSQGRLIIETQPLRLDCVYTARPDSELAPDEPPNAGELQAALGVFRPVIQNLTKATNFPEIRRIAYGAVLLSTVADRRTGYIEIARYLPFAVDADGSSDLLYQINRPRNVSFAIGDITVNRLAKWSVGIYQVVAFEILPQTQMTIPSQSLAAIRLELDINTAAEPNRVFNPATILEIFDYLVDSANEIVEKGDNP